MTPVAADLRLSAQRALLGAIYPEVRMVKLRRDGSRITFTAICEKPFSDDALDALTTATAEIAADFPDCEVDENIAGSNDPPSARRRVNGGLAVPTGRAQRPLRSSAFLKADRPLSTNARHSRSACCTIIGVSPPRVPYQYAQHADPRRGDERRDRSTRPRFTSARSSVARWNWGPPRSSSSTTIPRAIPPPAARISRSPARSRKPASGWASRSTIIWCWAAAVMSASGRRV